MALTELGIKNLSPQKTRYMVRDDRGLYIEIHPNGHKFWKIRYKVEGKEKKVSLGEYPYLGLKEARLQRDAFYVQRISGNLPSPKETKKKTTFKEVALEWLETRIKGVCSDGHAETVAGRLERFLFPTFGDRNIGEINTMDLLTLLRRIQEAGTVETAHRVKQIAGQVFRYGIATGVAERDISADLKGALKPKRPVHLGSASSPQETAALIRTMMGYQGSALVEHALWFSAYTFARPGEVRQAEWSEIDFVQAEWRLPPEKMKKRRQHIVPLSRQVFGILRQMQALTGHGRFVFPGNRNLVKGDRPMSENTITAALRRLGLTGEEMTAHGFRSMASTNLNEQGWAPDVIERQLAHVERNAVRAAYNYAEYLPERRKMMQAWADWLDSLK